MWAVSLALLVSFTVVSKSDVIDLPRIAGFYLAAVLFITIVCIIAAFIFDLTERIKKERFHAVAKLFQIVLIALLAALLSGYFIDKRFIGIHTSFVRALTAVCGWRAGNFLFNNKNI